MQVLNHGNIQLGSQLVYGNRQGGKYIMNLPQVIAVALLQCFQLSQNLTIRLHQEWYFTFPPLATQEVLGRPHVGLLMYYFL